MPLQSLPDYGPGIGAGITAGVNNFIQGRFQRQARQIALQQAADAHRAAGDEHTAREIENALNGYIAGIPPTGGASTPASGGSSAPMVAPPSAQTPDEGLVNAFMQSSSQPANQRPGVGELTPSAQQRGDVSVTPAGAVSGPDSFTQNLTASLSRAGNGAKNLPGRPQAGGPTISPTGTASTTTAQPGEDPTANFQSNLASSFGGERIQLPEGGSIDPFAGFRRQLMLEQAKNQITTQGQIAVSNATGETDKNAASAYESRRAANTPRLGDPGYAGAMGDVATAEANARLGSERTLQDARIKAEQANAVALENLRQNHELARQQDQQLFEKGQLSQQALNARELEREREDSDFVNRSAEIRQEALGSSMLHHIPGASTTPPSRTLLTTTQKRADWDAAAAHLNAKGDTNPSATLGPRP